MKLPIGLKVVMTLGLLAQSVAFFAGSEWPMFHDKHEANEENI